MTWDPYCTPPGFTPIARLGQLWKHHAVTHPSTNIAKLCLASVILRELVYLKCYAVITFWEGASQIWDFFGTVPKVWTPPQNQART